MQNLAELLQHYRFRFPEQITLVDDFLSFLSTEKERPFHRENLTRHMTGSAWLLDPSESKVLLTHHRKLNMWIQLGGHADGNPDILEVATREAEEESGIHGITPIATSIFDIDKHLIPARPEEPEHYHYDIRFLLKAPHPDFSISAESKSLGWLSFDDPFFQSDAAISIKRMHLKWVNYLISEKTLPLESISLVSV